MGVGAAGDQLLLDRLEALAGDVLGGGHAFMDGGVRELVATDQVADGVDALDTGAHPFVDLDETLLAELEPDVRQTDAVAARRPADGDQELVDLELA